ncbi:MAG: IclR family transcriptional regulator [Desulfitobacteriaceae bacterium]
MDWLDRFTLVMDIVSEAGQDGLGVTEIANRCQLTKGTMHRMLKSMVEQRLVNQDARSKKYYLGPRSMMWGSRFLEGQDPAGLLTGYCDLLAERTGLYSYLCRFNANEVYCIYARQPVGERNQYFVHVGQRMPLHCTAAAKSILAFQPPSTVDSLFLKENMTKFTQQTKVTPEELVAELNEVSRKRIALCEEELEIGVSAVSAPVFHDKGRAELSISLIGSASYIEAHRETLVRELLEISTEASEHIKNVYVLTSTRSSA